MAGFWDQGPTQDFNVGGFSPAPTAPPAVGDNYGRMFDPMRGDPRLTTQQPGSDFGMPYQQGPGGTLPPWLGQGPATGVGDPNAARMPPMQDNMPPPPDWNQNASGQQPLPDWMQKNPVKVDMSQAGNVNPNQWGTSDQTGQLQPGTSMSLRDVLQGRLQAIQQQHPAGSLGGNILQAFNNPQFQAFVASHRQTPSTPGMAQAGQVAGQLGQWMQGGQFQQPQTMSGVFGQTPGAIQQQMDQNGGFYAPPAMQMGPNVP